VILQRRRLYQQLKRLNEEPIDLDSLCAVMTTRRPESPFHLSENSDARFLARAHLSILNDWNVSQKLMQKDPHQTPRGD
jgi:hypothetical protein